MFAVLNIRQWWLVATWGKFNHVSASGIIAKDTVDNGKHTPRDKFFSSIKG